MKSKIRLIKIALWTAIVLICIAVSLGIASAIISNKLEKEISNSSIGTYKIQVRDITSSLITGNLTFYDAQLYDTTGGSFIVVPEFKIKGVQILKLIFSKKISLNRILINNAKINLDLDKGNKLKLPKNRNSSSKYNLENIGSIKISQSNILINIKDLNNSDSLYNTNLDIDIWNISNIEPKNYSYKKTNFDSLSFTLSNGSYLFPNKLYQANYETITYKSSESKLWIDLLSLKTRYAKYEIGNQTGTETDWFDFNLSGILMDKISLTHLLSHKTLLMQQVRINNFTGEAFKDKRLPFPEKPDTKLPKELVDSLPINTYIDSVVLLNANIEYSERTKNSAQAGVVSFNNINAVIKNIGNIDSLISSPTTMHASAHVMNEALLTAHFVFPNINYPGSYSAKGKMGSMKMEPFNQILKQNASVLVKDGQINGISFNFEYNNEASNGNLYFDYQDLNIAIIDKQDSEIKKVKTFLVNNIVLHKDNSIEKESFRKGSISFNRDKKRSIFNYWWKSMLSGIKSIAIF